MMRFPSFRHTLWRFVCCSEIVSPFILPGPATATSAIAKVHTLYMMRKLNCDHEYGLYHYFGILVYHGSNYKYRYGQASEVNGPSE